MTYLVVTVSYDKPSHDEEEKNHWKDARW